jgi:hypothetical protein
MRRTSTVSKARCARSSLRPRALRQLLREASLTRDETRVLEREPAVHGKGGDGALLGRRQLAVALDGQHADRLAADEQRRRECATRARRSRRIRDELRHRAREHTGGERLVGERATTRDGDATVVTNGHRRRSRGQPLRQAGVQTLERAIERDIVCERALDRDQCVGSHALGAGHGRQAAHERAGAEQEREDHELVCRRRRQSVALDRRERGRRLQQDGGARRHATADGPESQCRRDDRQEVQVPPDGDCLGLCMYADGRNGEHREHHRDAVHPIASAR